jgi:predicted dinucleotide-binding enzyme
MSTTDELDTIGIIGAGRLGQALARLARRPGRPVVIANSRCPESLTSWPTLFPAPVA